MFVVLMTIYFVSTVFNQSINHTDHYCITATLESCSLQCSMYFAVHIAIVSLHQPTWKNLLHHSILRVQKRCTLAEWCMQWHWKRRKVVVGWCLLLVTNPTSLCREISQSVNCAQATECRWLDWAS